MKLSIKCRNLFNRKFFWQGEQNNIIECREAYWEESDIEIYYTCSMAKGENKKVCKHLSF